MSTSQRKRRLRRRQVAARPRSGAVRSLAVVSGSLLTTTVLAAVPSAPAPAHAESHAESHGESPAAPRAEEVVALVRDVDPGSESSYVTESIALGDQLVLALDDGSHGVELWRSDGSAAGTLLLADLRTGRTGDRPRSSYPRSLTRVGDEVFFFADDQVQGRELFRTDGTRSGTTRVTTLPGTTAYGYSYEGSLPAVVGDTVFFNADDPVHGSELWRTDDSPRGARMVTDIAPGSSAGRPRSSGPHELTALGDQLVFAADDGRHGEELWRTDGTPQGTVMLADIRPGYDEIFEAPASSEPQDLTAAGDRVYLSADDDVHGRELWSTDGTPAGTALVRDVRPGSAGSTPDPLAVDGRRLYLGADDGVRGNELWLAEDGDVELVTEINKQVQPYSPYSIFGEYDPVVVDGVLDAVVDDGVHGDELWRSDGTAAGTRLVLDLVPGRRPSSPGQLTVVDGLLHFTARSNTGRVGLWTSDGTRLGTRLLAWPGYEALPLRRLPSSAGATLEVRRVSGAGTLTAVDDELFFTASDGILGVELWSTDDAATRIPRIRSLERPRILGRRVVGSLLRATPGRWSPARGLTPSFQWYAGARPVPGATGPRFRPTAARLGQRVTVRVVVRKAGWRGLISHSFTTASLRRR